jgi:hypothetical protein
VRPTSAVLLGAAVFLALAGFATVARAICASEFRRAGSALTVDHVVARSAGFIAFGSRPRDGTPDWRVADSADGITWTERAGSELPRSPVRVLTDGSGFVLLDADDRLLRSSDGENWEVASEIPIEPGDGRVEDIARTPTGIVALTRGGTILRSPDGLAWTVVSQKLHGGEAIAADFSGRVIAGGSQGIVVSTDGGTTWASVEEYEGSWNVEIGAAGGRFYVERSGFIQTSTGGVIWTPISEPALPGGWGGVAEVAGGVVLFRWGGTTRTRRLRGRGFGLRVRGRERNDPARVGRRGRA